MKRVVGAAVFLLGLELAGWVGYNLLIERSPHTRNLPLLPCIILSPAFLYVGWKWMRGQAAWPRLARAMKDVFLDPLTPLSSDDPAEVQRALLEHDLLRLDLPRLYKAIRKPWADDGNEASSTRALLFKCLWKTHNAKTVDFVRNVFPSLPENREIRFAALLTLGMINTPESLTAMMDLLETYKPDLGRCIGTLFRRQYETHRHADVLFPRLVTVMPSLEYRHEAYRLAVGYRDRGKVIVPYAKPWPPPDALDQFINDLRHRVSSWKRRLGVSLPDQAFVTLRRQILDDFAAAMNTRAGLDKDSDAYADNVEILCTLLNAMGSLHADAEVMEILRRSLDDGSPHVALHATLSQLRLGHEVSPQVLHQIANGDGMRLYLSEALASSDDASRRGRQPALESMAKVLVHRPLLERPSDLLKAVRWVSLSEQPHAILRAVREIPPGGHLGFGDSAVPCPYSSERGFEVERHVDGYIVSCEGPHWHSRSWRVDEGTLIRYIWGCRARLGVWRLSMGGPSLPARDKLDAEFAKRLVSMPLVM